MTPQTTPPSEVTDTANSPHLALLNLTPAEQNALASQGFVAAEYRRGSGPYFKLRFRLQGRQVVRYLGVNPEFAKRVEKEVAELQRPRRQEQQVRRLNDEAHRQLRHWKQTLEPFVTKQGYHFHGFALRKARRPSHKQPVNV